MALDLDELHKKEKKRLRTPKVSQRKTMMPWDKHADSQELKSSSIESSIDYDVNASSIESGTTIVQDSVTEKTVQEKVISIKPIQVPVKKKENDLNSDQRDSKSFLDSSSNSSNVRNNSVKLKETQSSDPQEKLNLTITDSIEEDSGEKDPKMESVEHAINDLDQPIHLSVRYIQLKGIQRKLTYYIYQSCKKGKGLISEELSVESLSEYSKTSLWSVKKSILRLMEKGVMSKYKFKNGRGGWTQYKLNQEIFDEIAQLERFWRSEGIKG